MPEVSGSQGSEKQREKEANCRTVTLSMTTSDVDVVRDVVHVGDVVAYDVGIAAVPKQDYTHMGRAGGDICTEVVMEVEEVEPDGALSKHNQRQPDAAIQEGDIILSVNGVHGDYDAMDAELAKDSVVLEVERREGQVHI